MKHDIKALTPKHFKINSQREKDALRKGCQKIPLSEEMDPTLDMVSRFVGSLSHGELTFPYLQRIAKNMGHEKYRAWLLEYVRLNRILIPVSFAKQLVYEWHNSQGERFLFFWPREMDNSGFFRAGDSYP